MNRRRYKKSNYRKRIIKTIVIISVVSFIVLFAVFMIVGLSLAEKTTDYTPFEDEFDYNESDSETARKPKNVKAYPLPLLEDNSIFSSRLAKIKEDATAVCISLNRPDGTLLYRSALASSFTYLEQAPDASSLSNYIDSIEGRDLYTTATLYIPTFSETQNDLEADVELSIWGSIVCEAVRSGVGDVLIIANDATVEDAEKLSALAERIHITEEDAIIGLCIPSNIWEDEKSVSLIESLSKAFDYLALDTTELPEKATLSETVEDAVAEMQLQLMYYKMRVLLPRGENTEELEKLVEIVTNYSISSWQALPLD